jgi:hypothetical protein
MGAFEDFVNQNLGIRRPIITDAGHPSQSLKAAGIVGTNYINSNNNQLYEKTGEDNINDWMPIGKLGHSRFSGESGIYLTVTGNSGFFENQNVIGTGAQINFIVTDEGFVGINTAEPVTQLHVSGNAIISGGNLILDYDHMYSSNPNIKGAVWRDGTTLKISAG